MDLLLKVSLIMICRVAAKKIVTIRFWLRFSVSWSSFSQETWNKHFVPNLSQCLECGATKLSVYKMVATVHGKITCSTSAQKKILFRLLLITYVMVAPIPVVRNLSQTFHLVDLDSSIWFRHQLIACA